MKTDNPDNFPAYQEPDLEGERLTGGPSLKQLLLGLIIIITIATGASAWYFEVGASPQHKRERYVKLGRESSSRGMLNEAIIYFKNAIDADPSAASPMYELGLVYLRTGGYREALGEFLRATERDPKLIPARYQLGKLFAEAKALTQADEQLLKIRELNPNAVEAILLGADIAAAEGNLDRAVTILKEAIHRDPKKAFYLQIGGLFLRKNDYQSAEAAYNQVLATDPNSYYARTALAAVYLAMGRRDQAEEHLLTAVRIDPENDELVKVLGNFYSVTRQTGRLENLYRDLLKRKPDSVIAQKVLAEIAIQKGDLKQAKNFTDAIQKKYPDDIDLRYLSGRLLLSEGNYAQAEQELSSVVSDAPRHAPGFYHLGLVKHRLGKLDDARSALSKAVELVPGWSLPHLELAGLYIFSREYRQALQEVQEVLKSHPDNRSALYVGAGAYYQNGDYDKALEMFDRIKKLYPLDPAARAGAAGVYLAQFKSPPAIAEYEEALRLNPDYLEALNSIARILLKEGKVQAALDRLENHLTKTRDKAGIYQIVGQLNVNSGDLKKGIAYLEKALESNPNLISTYLLIGSAHAKNQNLDDALIQYQKAAQRNPKAIAPQMLIATIYDGKHEYAQANRHYLRILELNPSFAAAANNLAWNIAEYGGDLDVALQWAEKARENDPYNPLVVDTVGWVTFRRGSYAKALTLLKESSDRLSDKNPTVLYHVGMAYYKTGKRDLARAYLGKALKLKNNFPGAEDANRIFTVLGARD